MDLILKLIVFVVVFTTLSIVGFRLKKKKEIEQVVLIKKLQEDALAYFVRICFKTLTPYNDNDHDHTRVFKTFKIQGNELFVYRKKFGKNPRSKIILHAKMTGDVILDLGTGIPHSYGSFEHHLVKVLGDAPVYDSQIRHLWGEMKRESVS
jgi:hypothetical protein